MPWLAYKFAAFWIIRIIYVLVLIESVLFVCSLFSTCKCLHCVLVLFPPFIHPLRQWRHFPMLDPANTMAQVLSWDVNRMPNWMARMMLLSLRLRKPNYFFPTTSWLAIKYWPNCSWIHWSSILITWSRTEPLIEKWFIISLRSTTLLFMLACLTRMSWAARWTTRMLPERMCDSTLTNRAKVNFSLFL